MIGQLPPSKGRQPSSPPDSDWPTQVVEKLIEKVE